MIHEDHPRYKSLKLREKIIKAYHDGILAEAGMIAHGRGEAFDYLIGERTTKPAEDAIRAAAATLLLAENPVLSINGNTAALVAEEMIEIADILGAKIEINLFHRTPERIKAVEKVLRDAGAEEVLGTDKEELYHINGIKSPRATASSKGICSADVVLVPLEDGDRTEILIGAGKTVITIDLNPLSRTSKKATISITDNIIRDIPVLKDHIRKFKGLPINELREIVDKFDNKENLKEMLKLIDVRRYNQPIKG